MKSVHSRNPNASTTKEISVSAKIYEKARLSMVTAFLELGFEQASHRYDEENLTHHYRLSPCPEGTYSLESSTMKIDLRQALVKSNQVFGGWASGCFQLSKTTLKTDR